MGSIGTNMTLEILICVTIYQIMGQKSTVESKIHTLASKEITLNTCYSTLIKMASMLTFLKKKGKH